MTISFFVGGFNSYNHLILNILTMIWLKFLKSKNTLIWYVSEKITHPFKLMLVHPNNYVSISNGRNKLKRVSHCWRKCYLDWLLGWISCFWVATQILDFDFFQLLQRCLLETFWELIYVVRRFQLLLLDLVDANSKFAITQMEQAHQS